MAEPTSSLLPVLLGGGIGLIGAAIGVGGSLMANFLTSAAERKRRRGEKFEELVREVYRFDHWLTDVRDKHAYGSALLPGVTPLANIEAITTVHFPSLRSAVQAMATQAGIYQVWIMEAGGRRVANKLSEINDGQTEAYRPYRAAWKTLIDALRAYPNDFA